MRDVENAADSCRVILELNFRVATCDLDGDVAFTGGERSMILRTTRSSLESIRARPVKITSHRPVEFRPGRGFDSFRDSGDHAPGLRQPLVAVHHQRND